VPGQHRLSLSLWCHCTSCVFKCSHRLLRGAAT